MNRTVIVSLTDAELVGWLGDVYAESSDPKSDRDVMRIYDCGCSAKKSASDAKWRVRFSATCEIPHTA